MDRRGIERSCELAILGNRIAPPNTTNMPVISSPNTAPAIAFLPNSNHWRYIGVVVTDSDSNSSDIVYWLVGMGFQLDNATAVTATSQLPNQIIYARCYLLGASAINNTGHLREYAGICSDGQLL